MEINGNSNTGHEQNNLFRILKSNLVRPATATPGLITHIEVVALKMLVVGCVNRCNWKARVSDNLQVLLATGFCLAGAARRGCLTLQKSSHQLKLTFVLVDPCGICVVDFSCGSGATPLTGCDLQLQRHWLLCPSLHFHPWKYQVSQFKLRIFS